jgi:hypothetical protein
MALLPIGMSNGTTTGGIAWTRIGVFVKMAVLPGGLFSEVSSDLTLVDLDAGASGYFRLKCSADRHFWAEAAYHGVTASVNLTPAMVLDQGHWYWISALAFPEAEGVLGVRGQAWGGGATDGLQMGLSASHSVFPGATLNAKLGWGVSLSSSYAAMPNEAGYAMDALYIDTDATGSVFSDYDVGFNWPPLQPPDGDIVPGETTLANGTTHPLALYLCHDGVGYTGGAADSSGNGYDLAPGPQGCVIVADGPY